MRPFTLLGLALGSLLLLAGAAGAAEPAAPVQNEVAVAAAPAPVQAEAVAVATEAETGLCNLLEATQTNVLDQATTGYWCPNGRWYCQTKAQCKGFCGVGQDHFTVCENGCCNCLG